MIQQISLFHRRCLCLFYLQWMIGSYVEYCSWKPCNVSMQILYKSSWLLGWRIDIFCICWCGSSISLCTNVCSLEHQHTIHLFLQKILTSLKLIKFGKRLNKRHFRENILLKISWLIGVTELMISFAAFLALLART